MSVSDEDIANMAFNDAEIDVVRAEVVLALSSCATAQALGDMESPKLFVNQAQDMLLEQLRPDQLVRLVFRELWPEAYSQSQHGLAEMNLLPPQKETA